ncbi:MAG TPA: DMSO/selenate family reductase complex A subunit [Vicinamibacterales bacterium]
MTAPAESDDATHVVPVVCNHDCGGRCRLEAHVRGGRVVRITTDESPDLADRPQLRACLRGRAIGSRLNDPNRLLYPMKRVGARGEGRFERVSWDEAIDLVTSRLQRAVKTYGPGSVFIHHGNGDEGAISGVAAARRLMNLMGGHLAYYNSYTSACLNYTAPFITGRRDTSSYQTLPHSKLIVLNGFNPAETIFETNSCHYLARAKDAGAKVIVIDPRLTETAATFADEWLPLKPTTDVALFVAMAHVIVTEGLQDQAFLDTFCIGFDERHMPDGVPEGLSFRSYVLGAADGTPKTPEWAAPITGIDAATIRRVAIDYATHKPAQLLQGCGPQRHAYGEQSVRAGITLACMTGNLGRLGGGWGGGEGGRSLGLPIGGFPTGTNGVKARIPVFLWTDAVVRGTEMTERDGVKDGPLESNIKFIFNIAGNTLVNQHADINRTVAILRDERLVEFIVVSDQLLTPSARFADVLLPADHSLERNDLGSPWTGERYVVFGNKVVEPPGECCHEYWWLSRVAERLGLEPAFTEGKTREDWLRQIVAEARAGDASFPDYDELRSQGLYRKTPEPYVAFEKEIADPAHHPFATPSGRIEIFSKTLYDMQHPEIPGVPSYLAAWEGPEADLVGRYPLQCIGPHAKTRINSTYDENGWMEEAEPRTMWISRQDAAARHIADGDTVNVFNDRGALLARARVTRRMRPGVVSVPQGAWYTPDEHGVCHRGSVNILTSQRPTPLAHGNGQHTMLVDVRKA